jgi:hypothetical protein
LLECSDACFLGLQDVPFGARKHPCFCCYSECVDDLFNCFCVGCDVGYIQQSRSGRLNDLLGQCFWLEDELEIWERCFGDKLEVKCDLKDVVVRLLAACQTSPVTLARAFEPACFRVAGTFSGALRFRATERAYSEFAFAFFACFWWGIVHQIRVLVYLFECR